MQIWVVVYLHPNAIQFQSAHLGKVRIRSGLSPLPSLHQDTINADLQRIGQMLAQTEVVSVSMHCAIHGGAQPRC
jgi:hypothetical protein